MTQGIIWEHMSGCLRNQTIHHGYVRPWAEYRRLELWARLDDGCPPSWAEWRTRPRFEPNYKPEPYRKVRWFKNLCKKEAAL